MTDEVIRVLVVVVIVGLFLLAVGFLSGEEW